jgi:hypothetical protein
MVLAEQSLLAVLVEERENTSAVPMTVAMAMAA